MTKRTYEIVGLNLENISDLTNLVTDKREASRATPRKSRRRKRRYEERITKLLLLKGITS